MKPLRFLPLLFLVFVFSPLSLAAQETDNTGWPVEERCVGEPTKPPEDWTFHGAILMTGHYGIHAVSADLPTPYVVAFIADTPRYGAKTFLGVLSPDQHWYATEEGRVEYIGLTAEISVYKIVIYSTVSPHEKYEMDWENVFDAYNAPSIRWRDHNHIIYETTQTPKIGDDYSPDNAFLINPFTQEKTSWNGQVNPLALIDFFPSPDWTRTVYNQVWYDYASDVRSDWGLFDPITGNELASLPITLKYTDVVWSRDSSRFISVVGDRNQSQQLVIFDKEGTPQENIFAVTDDFNIESDYQIDQGFQWSSDARYLAFIVGSSATPYYYELYIGDFKQRQIFKTCFSTYYGLSFSPDGELLALNANKDLSGPILVLDLKTWSLYTVAYHNGDIIGWRGDDK